MSHTVSRRLEPPHLAASGGESQVPLLPQVGSPLLGGCRVWAALQWQGQMSGDQRMSILGDGQCHACPRKGAGFLGADSPVTACHQKPVPLQLVHGAHMPSHPCVAPPARAPQENH